MDSKYESAGYCVGCACKLVGKIYILFKVFVFWFVEFYEIKKY